MSEAFNLRHLSPFEHFLWLLDQTEPAHFSVSAHVEGHTTVAEWHAALLSLQQRHPLLAASIERNGSDAPYFRKRSDAKVPLRVVHGNSLLRFEAEIAREIATPFSDTKAPLLRVTLLHEEQRSIVVFVAHHSIADGISLAYAIRDIVQSLSGKTLEPLPVPPSHEEALGLIERARKQESHSNEGNGISHVAASPHPKPSDRMPHVKSLQLTRELTGSLRGRAREEHTSVNGAIASAIVFALKRLATHRNHTPLLLAAPISTRNVLNLGEQCGLFTDGGLLDLDHAEPTDFWQLARRAKSELSRLQSLDRVTESRRKFCQVFADIRTPETAKELASKILNANFVQSNLGDLPFDTQYGHLRLEAVWGPAVLIGTVDQHFLGVATLNGNLSFLYSSYAPIAYLLETVKTILAASCMK